MKKAKESCNRNVTLAQVLGLLADSQEIQIVGRTGTIKTEIETVKYIRKTEKALFKQLVEGVSVKEDDTYLVVRLMQV